jgi:haloacid dehalogenase-like hydrolase
MSKAKPTQSTQTSRSKDPSRRTRSAAAADNRPPTNDRSNVVFCDIGDILGNAVMVDTPPPPHLDRLGVFPFVRAKLEDLRQLGYRCGIISDTGDEKEDRINAVLKSAALLDYFERELLIYSSVVGMTKDSPEIFRAAAQRAGFAHAPANCMFVGEDPHERSFAAQAGLRVARDLSMIGDPFADGLTNHAPMIDNIAACSEDARLAALDSDPGPADPTDYGNLLARLEVAQQKLPPLYRDTVASPFFAKLRQLGPSGFNTVLIRDPRREGTAGLLLDIAHAILQNGEDYQKVATDAFEEVVSDLYDGFLSAQDRKGIKPPDRAIIAPLVKWGNPDSGPYTWPVDATEQGFDVGAAIVNLPPANARRSVMAWAALGHETAGHDVLHADRGLQAELAIAIQSELEKQHVGFGLPEYWALRIDETSSDVMGILNMGPAAGIGIISYFRGLNAAFGNGPTLRNTGPAGDPHPADILRGYLAAETVRLLASADAARWANLIEQETTKDLGTITLADVVVSSTIARQSAKIVAGVLATHKSKVLDGHALIEIQDWRDRDASIVEDLRTVLTSTVPLSVEFSEGVFAAHVVSAAVMAALDTQTDLPALFSRMIAILKIMHDKNPSWGPLFIVRPSTVRKDLSFVAYPESHVVRASTTVGRSVAPRRLPSLAMAASRFRAAVGVRCLSLAKAGEIVIACCPKPVTSLSQQLKEVGIADDNTAQIFAEDVRQHVAAAGCHVDVAEIPSDPDDSVQEVRDAVFQAAH